MVATMRDIECPCCHGNKYMEVVREDIDNSPTQLELCCRCQGTGVSEAEEFYLLNGLWHYDS